MPDRLFFTDSDEANEAARVRDLALQVRDEYGGQAERVAQFRAGSR